MPGLITYSIPFLLAFQIHGGRCKKSVGLETHYQTMRQLFMTVSFDLHTNHETPSRVFDTLGSNACVRSKVEGL